MPKKEEAHSDCLAAGSRLIEAESANTDDTNTELQERLEYEVKSIEHEYFETNPRKGEVFTDYAEECVSAGRKFSFYELGQRISWFHPSDSHGHDWGVNHNHVPVLARLVVERCPECLPLIELKASKYDPIFAERQAYVEAQETARQVLPEAL